MNAPIDMNAFAAQVCGMAPAADPQWQRPKQSELRGMFKYQHELDSGLTVDCYLDYSPAERQTHWEPGCSERIELIYALADGLDVAELMDSEKIEALALEDMHENADDHDDYPEPDFADDETSFG